MSAESQSDLPRKPRRGFARLAASVSDRSRRENEDVSLRWPKRSLLDDPEEEGRAAALIASRRAGLEDDGEDSWLGLQAPLTPRPERKSADETDTGPFDVLRHTHGGLPDGALADQAKAPAPDEATDDALGAFLDYSRAFRMRPAESDEPPPEMTEELALLFGAAAALAPPLALVRLWPALRAVTPAARQRLLPALRGRLDPKARRNDGGTPAPRPGARDVAELYEAYRRVAADPRGPADDPLVTLTDGDLREIIVERGGFKNINELVVSRRGWGLVKVIWKHGEFSSEPPEFQVSEDDVLALPEILRTKLPAGDQNYPERLSWVAERAGPDGKPRKIVYSARPFREDGKHRVVTVYVENPAALARQGREPLPLSRDREGGSSR